MRMIIKDADFSSVSIGKVEKDLSFSYTGKEAVAAKLLNPPYDISASSVIYAGNGVNDAATFPAASSGDLSYTEMTNKERFITDFIAVEGGMLITFLCLNSLTVPVVTCYDSSKNILTPPDTYSAWSNDNNTHTFTVPDGVAYVKFCMSTIQPASKLIGV